MSVTFFLCELILLDTNFLSFSFLRINIIGVTTNAKEWNIKAEGMMEFSFFRSRVMKRKKKKEMMLKATTKISRFLLLIGGWLFVISAFCKIELFAWTFWIHLEVMFIDCLCCWTPMSFWLCSIWPSKLGFELPIMQISGSCFVECWFLAPILFCRKLNWWIFKQDRFATGLKDCGEGCVLVKLEKVSVKKNYKKFKKTFPFGKITEKKSVLRATRKSFSP